MCPLVSRRPKRIAHTSADGRRPVYLAAFPILILGSLGVARSRSITELYAWRIVQAFGSGVGFSVGAGVIGDIYKLEERGKAMGIFTAVRPVVFCLKLPRVYSSCIGNFARANRRSASKRARGILLLLAHNAARNLSVCYCCLHCLVSLASRDQPTQHQRSRQGLEGPGRTREAEGALSVHQPAERSRIAEEPCHSVRGASTFAILVRGYALMSSKCIVQTSVIFMELLACNPLPYTLVCTQSSVIIIYLRVILGRGLWHSQ